MMQTLVINKTLIPYDFNISLGSELFNLRVDYNHTGGFFTIQLSKNGETLCAGEPIIYGKTLFSDFCNSKFPKVKITPLDPSSTYNTVTQENLCETVLLVAEEVTEG